MEKICVLGLGYIGLPTALILADSGYKVVGVDINEEVVALLNSGVIHIEEAGIEQLLNTVIEKEAFQADSTPEKADSYIIAVPTPINSNYTANLDYVRYAIELIIPFLEKGNTVIVESTIPPRTIDDLVAPMLSKAGFFVGEDLYLAHCPERVLPGKILEELVWNTRIVGGINNISTKMASNIYRSFVKGEILETTAVNAEMAKLMENTYRDVNIALANEFAKISAKLNINTLKVIELANKHPRVNLHQPGPGVGGHCLAVDPYFIIEKAPLESMLISNARDINNSMPEFIVNQVENMIDYGGKIAVLGITYKGNIDDVRESPALEIIELLKNRNYELNIHDPYVKPHHVNFSLSSFDDAIDSADCLLILSDHKEFKQMDEDAIVSKMKKPVIFDTKNCTVVNNKNIILYNYGNIYEATKRKEVLI